MAILECPHDHWRSGELGRNYAGQNTERWGDDVRGAAGRTVVDLQQLHALLTHTTRWWLLLLSCTHDANFSRTVDSIGKYANTNIRTHAHTHTRSDLACDASACQRAGSLSLLRWCAVCCGKLFRLDVCGPRGDPRKLPAVSALAFNENVFSFEFTQ